MKEEPIIQPCEIWNVECGWFCLWVLYRVLFAGCRDYDYNNDDGAIVRENKEFYTSLLLILC